MWQLPFAELPQCRCQLFKPKKTQVFRISFAQRSTTLTHTHTHKDGQRYSFASTYSQRYRTNPPTHPQPLYVHTHTSVQHRNAACKRFDIFCSRVGVSWWMWMEFHLHILLKRITKNVHEYMENANESSFTYCIRGTHTHIARESIVYLRTWCKSYIIFFIYMKNGIDGAYAARLYRVHSHREYPVSSGNVNDWTKDRRVDDVYFTGEHAIYCARDREREREARSSPSALHAHNAIR